MNKSKLKEGYYYEEKPFYDSLPDTLESPEYTTEIFSTEMTHQEILDTYKIKPYTLQQAAGVTVKVMQTLDNSQYRVIYFEDNGVLFRFGAWRFGGGQLSVSVYEVSRGFEYDAGHGACFSNDSLEPKTEILEPLETLDFARAIGICVINGYTVTKNKS